MEKKGSDHFRDILNPYGEKSNYGKIGRRRRLPKLNVFFSIILSVTILWFKPPFFWSFLAVFPVTLDPWLDVSPNSPISPQCWPPVNPMAGISALNLIILVLRTNLPIKTHRKLYWYTEVLRNFTHTSTWFLRIFHDFPSFLRLLSFAHLPFPTAPYSIPHHRRTARLSPRRARRARPTRPLLGFQDDAARGLEILQVLGVFRLGLDPSLGETSDGMRLMGWWDWTYWNTHIYVKNYILERQKTIIENPSKMIWKHTMLIF